MSCLAGWDQIAEAQATGTPFSNISSASATGPRIWLRDAQAISVNYVGSAKSMQSLASAQPLALAKGDFDVDGEQDVAVGYASANGGILAVYRGNTDAFAPQSQASFEAIGRGDFPSPFSPTANLMDLPVRPDFVVVGSLNIEGFPDIIVAQRGDSSIYLLSNSGKGVFAAPKRISVGGPITTLAAGKFGRQGVYSNLLVGISDNTGSYVMVYAGTLNGLGGVTVLPLQAPLASIEFAELGDIGPDAVLISGGKVAILHSSSMRLEPLSLPITAKALVVGSFIYDRNQQSQFAILGADGSLNFVAHSEFDPHAYTLDELRKVHRGMTRGSATSFGQKVVPQNGWKIVETFPGIASSSARPSVLLRTRISDHGSDDVMVLSPADRQMTVIAHPDLAPGDITFVPGEISLRPYNGSPSAAIAMRVNVDGRPGVVAIHQGQLAPFVLMPLPDPTFFPNRFDDPAPPTDLTTVCNNTSNIDTSSQCSLREAILKANSVTGTDTIMLDAGTYTLTLPKVSGDFSGQHGTLEVNDSANIVGKTQSSTIIQAGTSNANGVDMVMAVNEDINPITDATASISNLTLKFGHNRGTHGNDGDGGCMEFDTGSSGNANLTLTNVTLDSCSTTQGEGGGIAIFNFTTPGNGLVTFSNSIIQNNSASDTSDPSLAATAGGIWVSQNARMSMTNSQVLTNNATQVSGGGTVAGEGGGITITNGSSNSRQTVIHSSTISGNHAAGNGGGIHNESNLLIDQSSSITNNSAGTANLVNAKDGGGLWTDTGSTGCPSACTDVATLSKVTITGNTATGNGGGIAIGNDSGAGGLTMTFSRLAGNTAPAGNNLSNNSAPVSVTDNWWGTNTPGDTISTVGTGVTTFDPFIVLTHHASPATIQINQSSTLTGDMSADNHGTAVALGNLDQVIGLPITFALGTPALGSIPQAQPETLNASAQATATFNAGGTSGRANPTATVDQETALANDSSISSATEAGTTVTITTVGAHGFSTGETVVISGVGVGGYNGTFVITAAPTANTFTYTAATAGLGASSGGTANVGIVILGPPTITKAFGAVSIPLNGSTSLSFTVTDPNTTTALSGVAFSDTLPAGLVTSTPNGLTGSCGSGTITATAGTNVISLSGASLAANASCTFSVNVTGIAAGTQNNTTGNVTSVEGGTGGTASATLNVTAPPSIAKAFSPSSIPLNATTSLTFTITNPAGNTASLTGVAFTDTLPTGLTVANATATACGGTLTTTAPTGISLSGANIAANSQCQFSVTVTGAASGQYTNTTGNVTSTNGGTGNTASANLTVASAAAITKAFGSTSIPLNGTTSLTFNITNPNTNIAFTGIAFTDSFPAGLVVAPTPNLTNTCGGTATGVGGASSVSLSAGTLAASASCTVSLSVQGTTASVKNNSVQVTSTEGGTGNTSNAAITVIGPPTIAKAFGAISIPLNGSTSLSFTVTNPNTTVALSGVGASDTLPAGLVISTPNGFTGACGSGTITATPGTNVISLAGETLAANGSCTFSINVTGITAGSQNNTTGNVTSIEGGTGATASANLKVVAPPSIAKVFNPSTIGLNATTSLTFTITNPAGNPVSLTGVAFTDTLPTGLTVASGTPTVCGGTLTFTAPTGIALSGATIAANSQCQFSVTITGAASGQYTNTTGNVTSTNGGTGNTASANLTVATPPKITKAFSPISIPLNGTTSLSFTIDNQNTGLALTGVAFTDALPGGLVVATPNGLTSTCGGTVTAAAGSGSVALAGGSLAANGSCSITLNIKGIAAGVQNNTTGPSSSTESGTGTPSNTASVTVVGPPTIAKAFGVRSIPLNGSTSLSFTIQNANAVTALTGVGFSDTLPAGLVISTPNGLTGSCGGGTITATSGTNVISLSGGTIAASASCTFSANVTGITAGLQTNTTGNVTSTQGGTGGTATDNVKVEAPPSITKVFNPSTTALNGTTSLTFTITNPAANVDSLAGVAFTDTLPAGLTVASGTATVCGGTLTTTAPTGIALTGATIAASGQCQFSVTVTGTASGQFTNTTGNVTSTNGGTGNTATANLTVATPPVIAKAFAPTSIPLNGSTNLSFTISNPAANPFSLTGVAFTDNLPSGLVVSATPNLSNTCGGTSTAVGGSSIVSLVGGTVASNSNCVVSVTVTGTAAGAKNNSITVTSTQGAGNTSSASVTVIAAPTISKAFGATSIPLNESTSLSFTIQNPNAASVLSGVGFTDTLPLGLVIANPNGATENCGGTISATPGGTAVSLSGATLAAGSGCLVSVNVTGTTAGTKNNITGLVMSTEGGAGGMASASLDVVAAPSIAKSFSPSVIAPNASSALTFTIANPAANSVALTGVAFTDALPSGLIVATPNGLTGSCGTGVITAAAGTDTIGLSGAAIPAGGLCNFSVNVVGPAGNYTNTTGAVTSTNGGTGNIATASLTVGAAPVITKTFGGASLGLGNSISLTFTIANPNSSLALSGVAFTDPLPSGLVVRTPSILTGTCGGTVSAVAGSQVVALSGGSIAAGGSCTFDVIVTAIAAGNQVNTTGNVSSSNGGVGNTATASVVVLAPDLTISKTHTGNFFQGQTNASYTVTVANVGAGPTAGVVMVTEVPPAAFSVTALSGTGWTCDLGTLSCGRSEALAAGATYPAITVSGAIAATAADAITDNVTVAGGGELNLTNDSASDTATVTAPPDFALSVGSSSITIRAGASATYSISATPLNNNLTAPITFTVTGLPPKSTFTLNPATITLGTSQKDTSLTVVTSEGDPFIAQNSQSRGPLLALLLPVTGLMFSGFGLRKRMRVKAQWLLGVVLFSFVSIFMTGCAPVENFQRLGTAPGSYTVTITATSGSIQHSIPVTLIVKP